MVTSYNVISSDGFIARPDGSEDFIPDEVWDDFLDICRNYDTVVIGRKTYETIQGYPKEMVKDFEDLNIKKIIVTSNDKFIPKYGYLVANSPKDALLEGQDILLTSGPSLNSSALSEGLIDKVILNILPEKIGFGIKVFDTNPKLTLLSAVNKTGNRKLCTYSISDKRI